MFPTSEKTNSFYYFLPLMFHKRGFVSYAPVTLKKPAGGNVTGCKCCCKYWNKSKSLKRFSKGTSFVCVLMHCLTFLYNLSFFFFFFFYIQLNSLHSELANQMADSMVFPLIQFREKDLTGRDARTHAHTHTPTRANIFLKKVFIRCQTDKSEDTGNKTWGIRRENWDPVHQYVNVIIYQ